jgi:hypothetical protein
MHVGQNYWQAFPAFDKGHITHETVDHSVDDVGSSGSGFLSCIIWAGCGGDFGPHRASALACLRAADLPRAWLHLDSRVLGLGRRRRLLLGAGNVGDSARWNVVDAGVLGMGRRRLSVASGILGPARRLLRRN